MAYEQTNWSAFVIRIVLDGGNHLLKIYEVSIHR